MSVKGTRMVMGYEAEYMFRHNRFFEDLSLHYGFKKIYLPSLESQSVYTDKVGPSIVRQLYAFKDKGGRDICLRPEGTATLQEYARTKTEKDIKVFYTTRCWRYERPQKGRYREFTQFGVEWLNPRDPQEALRGVRLLAHEMVFTQALGYLLIQDAPNRGLHYYTGGGFEASAPWLGAQKQILGGGAYAEGAGFAIGLERFTLATTMEH